MEIFKLFGSVFIDNEKANKKIDDTDKKGKGLSGTFGKMIGTAAKWGAAIGTAAVAAGGAMFAMANKAAATTDRIDKLSQKIGLSRQGFQEWEFILSQNGTSIEQMQMGMKTLTQRMDESVQGVGEGVDAFKKLKLDAVDPLSGSLKSQEQMFEETVKALQSMPDGAEKSRLAVELFGRAGQELMPLLNGAGGSVDELKAKAEELGLVLSDEAIDAGVKFTDTMDQVKRAIGAVSTRVGAALIPAMQGLAEWVMSNMPLIQTVISTVFEVLEVTVSTFIKVIRTVMNILYDFFLGSTESAEEFKIYFQLFYEWFAEIFELIKEILTAALEAMKDFWAKHGEDIMNIVKPLFEAIKVVIDTAMKLIKSILQTILAVIKGDWRSAWEEVRQIFVTIWEGIKNILPSLLQALVATIRGYFSIFKTVGKNLFDMVWEGMKMVWEGISSWVSDKIDWLTDKLAFWRSGNEEMNSGSGGNSTIYPMIDGSHASGLAYVPFDGYKAELHKGERILTAEENQNLSGEINNNFIIQSMIVRDDQDIIKIAKELHNLQKNASRGRGLAPA